MTESTGGSTLEKYLSSLLQLTLSISSSGSMGTGDCQPGSPLYDHLLPSLHIFIHISSCTIYFNLT